MAIAANLGFPRIGARRELKKALESFWSNQIDLAELENAAAAIRRSNWRIQQQAGIEQIPSNEFSLYDHVLDMCALVGAVPSRFGWDGSAVGLDTYFQMARGKQKTDADVGSAAMEMTKWFDTNYHYIVPEFSPDQRFSLSSSKPLDEFVEAKELGIITRPVLLGPVSFLLLGKMRSIELTVLELLPRLLPVYADLLRQLEAEGAHWVQLDEPCLALDLDGQAKSAYRRAYAALNEASSLKLLVATYFGDFGSNLAVARDLPVDGLHVDLARGSDQLERIVTDWPTDRVLSAGVVEGRNIWRNDLSGTLVTLQRIVNRIDTDRLWISPSCSLLHVPVDLDQEDQLDERIYPWLAFARQKLDEIAVLTAAVNDGQSAVTDQIADADGAMRDRHRSTLVHDQQVQQRMAAVDERDAHRHHPFAERRQGQHAALNQRLLPTTTIGSFPQTPEIRQYRARFRRGEIDRSIYEQFLRREIEQTIRIQEQIGLDVLVHGEPERNDMVQYFGEQMTGIAFTQYGWVQSYGSRCVRPPIIFGDVARPKPMTVAWTRYAQSLTDKPVKGMLTGPVTILQWSFVRDDQPRKITCQQIALAIRDEVVDLEAAGIKVIQIDEPAIREGLPLRSSEWPEYLTWAVKCFRLASCGVKDQTQIHTHMCYSEFNDMIDAIADMDADVISIEASRSQMELLDAFNGHRYPNEIGPGVYDIHSPRIPAAEEMQHLLREALTYLSPEQLWVNPDCGLKTRRWDEVRPALQHMVDAAQQMRDSIVADNEPIESEGV